MSTHPTPREDPHLTVAPEPARAQLPALPTLPPSMKTHPVAPVATLLLTGALLGGDLALIKPALDLVLGEHEQLSWTVAATISIAATAVAWSAGATIARHPSDQRRRTRQLILPTLLWTAVATGLFALRYLAAVQANPDDTSEAWLIAALTSAVFACTAWLAAHHAKTSADPLAKNARAAHDRALKTLKEHDDLTNGTPLLQARAIELDLLLTRHRNEAQRLTDQGAHAQQAAAELAAELKAHARAEIARHLGRPEAVPPATTD